jgi:hypothetical protein
MNKGDFYGKLLLLDGGHTIISRADIFSQYDNVLNSTASKYPI